MKHQTLLIFILALSTINLFAQFNPDKPELCQRNFYTEAQAVEVHKAVAAQYNDQSSWEKRAQLIRQGILDGGEIKELSRKKPKNITRHSRKELNGYAVENVSFQSLPGIYVTGNLYTPLSKKGKLAAILAPHGHGPDPRYKEYVQQRCATLARMRAAVFAYDMVGQGDSKYCEHKIEKALKLQLINSTYVLNFLLSRPDVDKNRVAISGESGGGTQSFMLAAVDERIKVCVPVVMVSGHFFGGCTCESGMPVHKRPSHITSNLEIAALFAPKPLLLISDGDDWTKNTPNFEYPFVQRIYGFYNKEANVENAHFPTEKHDYNASKRQAAYAFLAKHLGLNTAGVLKDGKFDETTNTVLTEADLKVFNEKFPLPGDAVKGDEAVGKVLDAQR